MPVVTSIKPQKSKKRVNVFLDEKFGFGLDLETFVKYGIKKDLELSEGDIAKIVKESEFQKIYNKILRFGSLRPRSEKEYEKWLSKYKVHHSLYKELFFRLKSLNLLDDKKFSIWWVEQRSTFRPKGNRVLRQELRQKGIDKRIIDEVLTEAKIDEVGMARKLLEKKKRVWRNLEEFEVKVKMSQYLARRGFDWEVISKVIKGITVD